MTRMSLTVEESFNLCDTVEIRVPHKKQRFLILDEPLKGLLLNLENYPDTESGCFNSVVLWMPSIQSTSYFGSNHYLYHTKMVLIEKQIKNLDYFIYECENVF